MRSSSAHQDDIKERYLVFNGRNDGTIFLGIVVADTNGRNNCTVFLGILVANTNVRNDFTVFLGIVVADTIQLV